MSTTGVVVVGSGPTGAAAALALLASGIPVTVLESGPRFPGGLVARAFGRNALRRAPSEQRPLEHVVSGDPATTVIADLVPGGLSNRWGGVVPRFAPADFEDGARLHEAYDWPLRYEELRPHYDWAERQLRISAGTRGLPQLPAQKAKDRRELPPEWRRLATLAEAHGAGLVPLPLAEGARWMAARQAFGMNSYTAFLRPLASRSALRLLLGAHALELEWGAAAGRVTGVVYHDSAAGLEERIACAGVVVAAGTLGSAKLLLDSTSATFPEGLGNAEGVLGHYLHDHAHAMTPIRLGRPIRRLQHGVTITRDPYPDSEPLQGAQTQLSTRVSWRENLLSFTPLRGRAIAALSFASMVPRESNRVSRHPERRDAHGRPLLEVSLRFDKEAVERTRRERERVLALFDMGGYAPQALAPPAAPVPGASAHLGGTVRMHASPRYGMLDRWGRLHAVPNVVVADASAFTTGPEKNPTLTAMALAGRAAQRLALDLRRS